MVMFTRGSSDWYVLGAISAAGTGLEASTCACHQKRSKGATTVTIALLDNFDEKLVARRVLIAALLATGTKTCRTV
jgi:hypothetical protein